MGFMLSGSGDVWSQANDCVGAAVICSDGAVVYNPTGPGADDFADPDNDEGCLGLGEHLSAWYYFAFDASMPAGSSISFDILPDDGDLEDYDFAIYGTGASCDDLGSPVRCSFAAVGLPTTGATGLGNGANDTSEDAFGDSYVAPLTVNPGEGYFLVVDNYAASNMGFTLNWGGSAATYLDCTATPNCNVSTIMSWD